MKKIFFMLLATISLMACDNGGDTPKPIELTGGTTNSQTVYADDTQKPNAIKFNATAPWTATVKEVPMNKAGESDVPWLTLNVYEGKAGEQSITLTILPNTTGADRKAEIRITCAGTTITITVEQKATNKSEDPSVPKPKVRYINKLISNKSNGSDNSDQVMTFEYDNQMRITKINSVALDTYNNNTNQYSNNVYFTYKGNTISISSREIKNGIEQEEELVCNITLNPDGTAKQSTMFGIMMSDDTTVTSPNMKSAIFSTNTRSVANKAATITKIETIRDYTYAQGYIMKIAQLEDWDGIRLHDYLVSWNNGNLSKVQMTRHDGTVGYDEFKYSNIENKPCNWDLSMVQYVVSSDAFEFLGHLGLLGKQSKNMPSSRTSVYGTFSSESEYTYTVDKEGYVIGCKETRKNKPNNDPGIPVIPGYHMTYTVEYVK